MKTAILILALCACSVQAQGLRKSEMELIRDFKADYWKPIDNRLNPHRHSGELNNKGNTTRGNSWAQTSKIPAASGKPLPDYSGVGRAFPHMRNGWGFGKAPSVR